MKKILSVFLAALFITSQAFAAAPAIPPTYVTIPPVTPIVVTHFGDSTAQQGNVNVPCSAPYGFASAPQCALGSQANSVLGWLRAYSDGGFIVDYKNNAYPGSVNGLGRLIVTTQGSCTASSTLTFQPSAPTGTPANTAGTFNVTFDASGHAQVWQNITLANAGSGYATPPTYTVSGGSCTTQPVFAYVLTGTGSFGVAGDRTSLMIYRVPDVCASTANIVVGSFGVNDLLNSVAPATTKANIATIVSMLQACNKRVVLEAITPVTSGTSGWSATMDKQRLDINAFEQGLCRAAATTKSPTLVCVDSSKYWQDATSATFSPLATMVNDGVHSSPSGAQIRAMMIYAKIKHWAGQGRYVPNSQNDLYDATNSPGGNMVGTTGLFLGTGGTLGTCTGTMATSWTQDWSGTGTLTCTAGLETTRTDGLSGQRQTLTISDSGGGATDRIRLIGSFSKNNFTLGTDTAALGIDIDVSNVTGAVEYIGCEAFETPSAGSYQGGLGLFGGNYAQAYPLLTSAQLAKMQEAKAIPDFGLTAAGSYRISCETPPITTQTTATSYNFYVYVYGGGTWTATLKFGDAWVRKNQ
jgi:lysophospholipase L1-like esterase